MQPTIEEQNTKNEFEQIEVFGAREHNLQNIDVSIPRNQLVVFTGLSGSGKSSLAFDTIFAEGQRTHAKGLVVATSADGHISDSRLFCWQNVQSIGSHLMSMIRREWLQCFAELVTNVLD